MKKIIAFSIILLSLVFLVCETKTPITSGSKSELEKVKEYIIGKWVQTESEIYVRADSAVLTFTRRLQFGTETFEYESDDDPDYHGLYVRGNYVVESPEQISVEISEVPEYGGEYPFIIQIPLTWEPGDIMFWEIQSLSNKQLIICFEPNVDEQVFYTFVRSE